MSRRQQVDELADKVQRDLKLSGCPIGGTATNGTTYASITAMWRHQLGLQQHSQQQPTPTTTPTPTAADPPPDTPASQPADTPPPPNTVSWYERAYDYWEGTPATVDGVLGGYGELSSPDIAGSVRFLGELRTLRPELGAERAADCGAGIGRVTRGLLAPRFEAVDLVEQSPQLIAAAPKYLGAAREVVEFVCCGLQDFMPAPATYDVVWAQWVVGHLTDVDFIRFLHRMRTALRPGGVIVIKDNCCSTFGTDAAAATAPWADNGAALPAAGAATAPLPSPPPPPDGAGDQQSSGTKVVDAVGAPAALAGADAAEPPAVGAGNEEPSLELSAEQLLDRQNWGKAFVVDSDDSSVTRGVPYFRSLVRHAGLTVVSQRQEVSAHFPDEIFPVFYFALC